MRNTNIGQLLINPDTRLGDSYSHMRNSHTGRRRSTLGLYARHAKAGNVSLQGTVYRMERMAAKARTGLSVTFLMQCDWRKPE